MPLQNRYSFTDLAELTCQWQDISGRTVIHSGTMRVKCAPRSTTTVNFPSSTSMDTLRIEFIHPDGRSIYAARLHVQGAPILPFAPPSSANGAADITEKPETETASAAGSELTIDRKTGAILSWQVDGANLLSGGLTLNLGERRANHGNHDARNFIESKQSPIIQSAEVTTQTGIDEAHIVVRGLVRLAEQSDPVARLTIIYTMRKTGEVGVKWELAWAGDGVNCRSWAQSCT